MSPTHTRTCPKCGEQECRLAVQITTAGAQNVHLQCGKCAGLVPTRGGALWIPHKELEARGLAVDDLPVSRDDSRMTRCIHCGARGAEYHHWAAQAIFEDAGAKGLGVVSLGTKMIDPPVVLRAQRVLAQARLAGRLELQGGAS